MGQACKQWILAGAAVCALGGLVLMATDPVEHHEAPPPRVKEQPRRVSKAAGPPLALPTHVYVREERLPALLPAAMAEDEPALDEPPQPAVAYEEASVPDRPPWPAFALAPTSQRAAARPDDRREPATQPARRPRVGRRMPVTHRRPPRNRAVMAGGATGGAGGATGGQPPAEVPTAPAPGMPSRQPVVNANLDPAAAHDVAFQSGDTQFPTTQKVAIPIDPKVQQEGSVSLLVKPGWQPGNQDDATLVQLGDRLRLSKTGDVLRLEAADATTDTDGNPDVGVPITDWKAGEWHHVTATWNQDVLSFYVDGELIGRRERGHADLPPDGALLVGSDAEDDGRVAPGSIGRVDVRSRALDDDEVAKDFHDAVGDDDPPGHGHGPHDEPHDHGHGPDDHGHDDHNHGPDDHGHGPDDHGHPDDHVHGPDDHGHGADHPSPDRAHAHDLTRHPAR